MFLTSVFLWIFRHEPVWLAKYNELVAGLLGSLIAIVPGFARLANGHPALGAFFIFNAASLVYEAHVDPNGYELKDVGERLAAFFLGLIVLTIIGAI